MRRLRRAAGFLFVAAVVAGALVSLQVRRAEAGPEPAPPPSQNEKVQYCLLFGLGDAEPTPWDGSIQARGARILQLDGWRLDEGDALEESRWTLATRRVILSRRARSRGVDAAPVLENGVYVTAEILDADARFTVQTKQGRFTFDAGEARYGNTLSFLDGRVKVEQVPYTTRLSQSIEEQDYPALAAGGDTVYLAYVEFTHGDRSQAWPWPLSSKPESFEPLARPAGGDRVMLREYSKANQTWSGPQPVSAASQDVYRASVAVDGQNRVWVIWSAQKNGNFDLYARHREGEQWSEEIRVTEHPGPDLNPVAVTDSTGAVWVAWQGFRGSFDILAARQQGGAFSPEQRVSPSDANDWAPQIAAGGNGEVAVVWDTYDKGDYDIYLRRLRERSGITMMPAVPVAASQKFEARASVAYDAGNRIWVAYEESFPAWGKDFGAYETTGSGLYQGNHVRVRILEGDKHFTTADSLEAVLQRRAAAHPFDREALVGRPETPYTEQPDPALVNRRTKGRTPYPFGYPSQGYPRLVAGPGGSIALAYRNAVGNIWVPLGTAWFENVVYFDGAKWTGPVFLPHSDGLLDSRPAWAPLSQDRLLMVGVSDHRFSSSGGAGTGDIRSERFNFDLVAHEFSVPSQTGQPRLSALAAERPAAPMNDVGPEIEQVRRMRDYRARLGGETLRLLRGEFHRHTSISTDGGQDGDLIDAWRYMLDAAYMDWVGCCDHDNGTGREYTWWMTQKFTDAYHLAGKFVPMFSYERSVSYPEGHRNVVLAQRGVRPLPRLPKTDADSPPNPAPDTQMLYDYLRRFDGIAAMHTSGTNMGTDWRDNDPKVEPVVEIYQGDRQNYEMPGAPRSNTAEDSIGGWRPLGFVSLALEKGYRLAFQASSDHLSTHMSYCNLWVTEPTREAILDAFKKRRVYGATDNILADVRCSGHFMGEEFTLGQAPEIEVKLVGTAKFSQVHIVKDGKYAYSVAPGKREVSFSWRDNAAAKGKTSYYYVRGEQADGELVWVSPMWITVE